MKVDTIVRDDATIGTIAIRLTQSVATPLPP